MTGAWKVRHPALLPLYERARAAAQSIPGGVRFQWVPRHLNAMADSLAGGNQPSSPDATIPLLTAAQPAQDIAPQLAQQIRRINEKGGASFKEYAGLRVGGRDRVSEMRWNELAAAAGPECVRACQEAFPEDQRSQASALRWIVRGLAAPFAIKKVTIDQELAAKKESQARPG
jgi:hypothetical protein